MFLTVIVISVLAAAVALALLGYLVAVIRDDDRGHSFTNRRAPQSHRGFGEDEWTLH
ncbi:hypothetical protein [Georgenia thermotolerans]|uniref:Uncharacterized protein n=2 Tax=Georgenia thermotolerans TaxID=527326 RepID=A0A7J5UP56_9MICO|nr:hypothetical protein [Georgenia thermotolerans]KAE8763703.1 hypothetical protein GB883_12865 [Georgenia thermotolerans]